MENPKPSNPSPALFLASTSQAGRVPSSAPSPASTPQSGRFPSFCAPPLYSSRNLRPAFALRYDWTGWPAAGTFFPPTLADEARATAPAWEADGLRLLELRASPDRIQILFSATPSVSPVFCCQRAKGRLQHTLRKGGARTEFSRKVSFRSLGENTSDVVENYIRKQVGKGEFADPRFRDLMRRFTTIRDDVRLAEPSEVRSGRYWYNLHVVLVAADRYRISVPERLQEIHDAAFVTAAEGGHRIAALAVMPDHVHMAVRGNVGRSPEEIALAFQNALARAAGCRAWQDGYYAGSFSEYDLDVIRRITRKSSPPAGQAGRGA